MFPLLIGSPVAPPSGEDVDASSLPDSAMSNVRLPLTQPLRLVVAGALLVSCAGAGSTASTDAPCPPSSTEAAPSSKAMPSVSASAQAAARRKRAHATEPPVPSAAVKVDAHAAVVQNAEDPDGRRIFARGASCVIEVPPEGPEDAASFHGVVEVDCPADYDDPAWDACAYVIVRDALGCACLPEDGAKDATPKRVACPKLERKD